MLLTKSFFYFFLLYYFFIGSLCYSQVSPPTPVIGDNLIIPGDGFKNDDNSPIPDTQLYMPETFSDTRIFPTSRQREDLSDTSIKIKQHRIQKYTGGFIVGAQYGQYQMLPYTDIFFYPYIKLDHFFFAYECPLRFDWNSAFITQLWSSTAARISKIESDSYYKYTKKTSIFRSFKFTITPSPNLIQGHGKFFYDYNPNLYGPYETIKSLNLSLNIRYFGLKYTLANIANPVLMSTEIFVKPCAGLKKSTIQFLHELKLYLVYGVDTNPFPSYSKGLYLFPSKTISLNFSMLETGIYLPLGKTANKVFQIDIYGDFSYILPNSTENISIRKGSGASGGVLISFIERIPIRLEVSQAFEYWAPRWVNIFYNIDQVYVNQNNEVIPNKIMSIIPNLTYLTTALGFKWEEKGIFMQAEIFNDFSGNTLWLTLSCTITNKLWKLLSFHTYWTVRAIGKSLNLQYKPESTVLEIKTTYHMLPNMNWGLLWKMNGEIGQTFDENNQKSIISIKPFIFLGIDFSFRY